MKCHNCGAENREYDKFCLKCGQPLGILPQETDPEKLCKGRKGLMSGVVALLVFISLGLGIVLAVNRLGGQKVPNSREKIVLGDKYINEMEYDKAIAAYRDAIKIEPLQIEGYEKLADAYILTSSYGEASDTYEQALAHIDEEYENTNSVPEGSEDFYEKVVDYYIEQENEERADEIVDEAYENIGKKDDSKFIYQIQKRTYAAYAGLLEAYEDWFGEVHTYEADEIGYLYGLCFATLIDFDDNGIEELVLAHGAFDGVNLPVYTVEVWGYENAQLQYLYSGEPLLADEETGQLCISYVDEKVYLIDGGSKNVSAEEQFVWGYSEDLLIPSNVLQIKYETDNGTEYFLNGSKVTEKEFSRIYNKWWDYAETFPLYAYRNEQEVAVEGLEKTKQDIMAVVEKKKLNKTIPYLEERKDLTDVYSQYADVVQNYETAFQQPDNINGSEADGIAPEFLKAAAVRTDLEHSSYIIHDLNNDGIPELLIGLSSEKTEGAAAIYDIYTYNEGETWRLMEDVGQEPVSYIMNEYGIIYIQFSEDKEDGACYFLEPGSNRARIIETIDSWEGSPEGKFLLANEATADNLEELKSGEFTASKSGAAGKESYYVHLDGAVRKEFTN